MESNEWEHAYHSLMACIVGLISIADIIRTREMIEKDPAPAWVDYYNRAIKEHCDMAMNINPYIH